MENKKDKKIGSVIFIIILIIAIITIPVTFKSLGKAAEKEVPGIEKNIKDINIDLTKFSGQYEEVNEEYEKHLKKAEEYKIIADKYNK